MKDELSLDNILTEDQIGNLFSDNPIDETDDNKEETTPASEDTEEVDNINTETTETSPEELFQDESESVGSEDVNQGEKDTSSEGIKNSSNFYSSIANALVEDGILQNLDEEGLSNIKTAEDFAEAISSQIRSQMDERYKRVDEALNAGVEPTQIQKYEQYIQALDNITEDNISAEDDAGENLRKNLIYQDCINKGFSQQKAMKMVERSLKAGTDIEDAKDALQDNKTFYKDQYDSVVKKAKEDMEEYNKAVKKQAEEFKNSILNEKKAFGEIAIDDATRKKVYDSVYKPIYTDPDSGEKLTAIQKYERDNRTDFLKNLGLLFVLTDGFKSIDNLVNDKVKKETKKSLRNLENTLKSSGNNLNRGTLSFASNNGDTDPESLFKGWKLSV